MLRLSSARGKIAAGLVVLAMPIGAGVMASPAAAASYSCPQQNYVTGSGPDANRAYARCTVRSGQVRARARCRFYADAASRWVGPGQNHWLVTSRCPFGFNGGFPVYIESRG